jgi:ergothioneine biosynthesis protein EgtB
MQVESDPLALSSNLDPAALRARFDCVRSATVALCDRLSPEDACAQSMPDASPAKWHLAHTTWFFETLVLERELQDFRPHDPAFRVLFNSYYNGIGLQHPRPERGMLTRPSLDEVGHYRAQVDEGVHRLMEAGLSGRAAGAIELGLHHEQQHQELILTDIKHLLSRNPTHPSYVERSAEPRISDKPIEWLNFDEQLRWIGHSGEAGFRFDNEGPRHREFVESFQLASRPCTNSEFLAFMADDGYDRPELWLSDGWATVGAREWNAPGYWQPSDGGWKVMTLSGQLDVRPDEPVCHLSYYEADAFARWMGARLPSEFEWEVAAAGRSVSGNLLESGRFHPSPMPTPATSDSPGRDAGPEQMFGDVWEWTHSAYAAYPGFRALGDAFAEYNGKFMCNQNVLRGGSCATPTDHIRATYRNFFFPDSRWQFSGVRLARDAN